LSDFYLRWCWSTSKLKRRRTESDT